MRTTLDNYLGIHAQALTVEAKRNQLLAANLANVDTPNYKARDLDFKAALTAAAGADKGSATLTLRTGNVSQQAGASTGTTPSGTTPISTDSSLDAALKYRV